MPKEEPNDLICRNLDPRCQDSRHLERTFDQVWGPENDDNKYYDDYFPLDENNPLKDGDL